MGAIGVAAIFILSVFLATMVARAFLDGILLLMSRASAPAPAAGRFRSQPATAASAAA